MTSSTTPLPSEHKRDHEPVVVNENDPAPELAISPHDHPVASSSMRPPLDGFIAKNIAPTEYVLSLMDDKEAVVGLEQGALILAHYGSRSSTNNIKLLEKVREIIKNDDFYDLFFYFLKEYDLPNGQFLQDIALLLKEAGFRIHGQLNSNIARAMKDGKISEGNFVYLSELFDLDETTKVLKHQAFLTKLGAKLEEMSENSLQSLCEYRWADTDLLGTKIWLAKLHKLKLPADLLNIPVRMCSSLDVVKLLLKEGLQATSETVNLAFSQQAIPLIDYFHDLGLKPSQDAYFILFDNCWDITRRVASYDAVKINLIQCLRRLRQWWEVPFPQDFFRHITLTRHRSLALVDVCIQEGMKIPPEHFPEFVERLIGDDFSPKHLDKVEQTLSKLREKLNACDERHTFLHAVIHGKKPSPAVVAYLIQNKVAGFPSTELIEFAFSRAHDNIPKEVILSLLDAPEAKIGINEGAAILALQVAEADKVEYLKHFYARTHMLADDLLTGYLKIFDMSNRKKFEDNLRLIKEAGIPSSKLKEAILKAWREEKIGESNTRYLKELGYLDKQWIRQGRGMYERLPETKAKPTVSSGGCSLGSASDVSERNKELKAASDARLFRMRNKARTTQDGAEHKKVFDR